jgi:hypothetical protein
VDRASAYVDQETIDLLTSSYVPVGISLQEDLQSQDPTGEFFRKIATQRPEPKHSKQGYYIATPDGTLLRGWMYPRPDTNGTMKKNLKEILASYQAPGQIDALDATRVDRSRKRELPAGVVVVETRSKLLEKAVWPAAAAERFEFIKKTMGHDRLWILKAEVDELARGMMPDSLLERMVRFHLGDNTRCYLDKWSPEAMKQVRVELKGDAGGFILTGSVQLEQGHKGLDATLYGEIEIRDGALKKFDVAVRATAWGQQNGVDYAPLGKFAVGNAFTLARPGVTFDVLPVWNWVDDYLRTKDLRVSGLRQR